jgi:rfaE bifunctional protein nucleotidyltransferase chain/domain
MVRMGNYIERDELAAWSDNQRAAGLRIGFTCGAFDLLHAGHVDYLEEARGLCDTLIVAVNSDASIQQYKSPLRPVTTQEQRLRVVGALRCVDAVTLLDHPRPLPLIEQIKPHLYIKGGDYAASNLRSAKALEAWGGQAVVIKVRFDSSTTQTIERAALLALHAEPEKPPAPNARGIVLIDRDGTIVRSVPFLHEPARVELVPGVADALARLQSLGLRLAIVTNQQGIGLGYFTTDDFIAVNQAMLKQLATHGVRISKIYYCPHSLAAECPCRKPGTRMLERALQDFGFPAGRAFVVGDSSADSGAALALRIPSLRVQEDDSSSWDAAASAIETAVAQW